jgi:heat shock transcription factor, other eukaryote
MQNSAPNRKRPAPGASPMMQQPMAQQNYQYQQMSEPSDFNFDFSNPANSSNTFSDPASYDPNNFGTYGLNSAQPPTYGSNLNQVVPSTELVRRTRNQQLAAQNAQQEQWSGLGAVGSTTDDEDEAELERRADAAAKEGTAKRKQIPPFVQKLSRYV